MNTIKNILDVEKFINDLDAVIFDLDDTLYSEKEYVRSGYSKVAGLFPEESGIEKELWAAFEERQPAIDVVLAKHGLRNYKEKALEVYRQQRPNIHLYDGVDELLARIRKRKKTGIITDGRPEGQWAKINALGLLEKVDEIIITDELGGIEYRKPNDAAFRLMAEKLDVSFDRMAYVGDNIKKDFSAPNDLGMRSIFFENDDGLYQVK